LIFHGISLSLQPVRIRPLDYRPED
jgi:hypothetical protein